MIPQMLKQKLSGTMSGIVVSTKMKDTAVVEVVRFIKVPKYGKYVRRSKRYKAHDAGNTTILGQRVTIVPCRPISKEKKFKIVAGSVAQPTVAEISTE